MSRTQLHPDSKIEYYESRFAALRDQLPGASHLRQKAMEVLRREGLPTRRTETWKYTDLRQLFRAEFRQRPNNDIKRDAFESYILESSYNIVFVDGIFSPRLSCIEGLEGKARFESLAGFLNGKDDHSPWPSIVDIEKAGLAALNTSLMQDGVVFQIVDGVSIARPIQFIFVMSEKSAAEMHLRNLVTAGQNSEATIIQTYISLGQSTSFCNVVTELVLERDANLRHIIHQGLSDSSWHIGQVTARLERSAHLNNFVLSSGARLARSEISVDLNDNEANCSLKGLAMVRDRQHCDNTTDVIHNKPYCRSSQSYKNVLDGHSRTVFQGRIFVAPDSQKTEAHQMSRNLLLSRGANADSKPELIIHADDVKCSHGAAVGELDQEALFYLKTRGIDGVTARNMMVRAFVSDLLEGLPEDNAKEYLERFINLWLRDIEQFKEVA